MIHLKWNICTLQTYTILTLHYLDLFSVDIFLKNKHIIQMRNYDFKKGQNI